MTRSCAVLHTLNFTGKKEKKSLEPASQAALPVAKQCSSFWFRLLYNFSSQTAWNRKKTQVAGISLTPSISSEAIEVRMT